MQFKIIFINIIQDIGNCCIKKETKKTVLHLAVEKGNLEIIKLLLQNKSIDINVVDNILN